MYSTNPLRYPGGKFFLANYIEQVLDSNNLKGCTVYEPYAGSAAVSLEMLFKNCAEQIVIVERDPLLFSFWKSVVDHAEELCSSIECLDITLETWKQFGKYRNAKSPLEYRTVELGLAGLFFNRTNYSGILNANPLGGLKQESEYKIDCRFKKEMVIAHIKRIADYRDKIVVKWDDALNFLKNNITALHESNCFVYIDPPYYVKGRSLYRYFYYDEDHKALADFVMKCHFPWLISYDDHPFINNLYLGRENKLYEQKLYCDYSAQQYKRSSSEVLISNLKIPPPVYQYLPSNNTRSVIN